MYTYDDFNIKRFETKLSSGIPLLLLQKKGSPIAIEVNFFAGTVFDPPHIEGVPHFVEHIITAGTEKFPSKDKLAEYIEGIGGAYGAFTTQERLGINISVADKGDLDKAAVLLNEIISAPLFNEKIIESERGAILKEIGERIANPGAYIRDLTMLTIFQGTPAARSISGSEKNVEEITREDLLSFYNSAIAAERASIVVAGDAELSDITNVLEKYLNIRKSEKFKPDLKPLAVVRDNPLLVYRYKDISQVEITYGYRTCPIYAREDEVALSVLATISGGGRASRLSKKLRYEKGLVYGVGAASHNMANRGAFLVNTSTSKDKLQEVLDIISEEFESLAKGEIDVNMLEFVKNKKTKSSIRSMQRSESWVSVHSYPFMLNHDQTFPDYLNEVEKIEIRDLQRVAEKYFKKNMWYTILCGDITPSDVKVK